MYVNVRGLDPDVVKTVVPCVSVNVVVPFDTLEEISLPLRSTKEPATALGACPAAKKGALKVVPELEYTVPYATLASPVALRV